MPMDRPESVIQRGFTGGELSPVMHARADSPRYVDGLRTCRNFIVLRHGAVANRPGFRFVAECKTTSADVRLRRFVHSTPNESILVEIGVSYFRFYKNGARIELAGAAPAYNGGTAYVAGDLVSSGGVNYYAKQATTGNAPPNATFWHPLTGLIYEVPHTYGADGLIGGWEQSGNVITITHRLHDPRELVYFADTNWVLRLANTEPTTVAPANLVLTPNAGPGIVGRVAYLITAAGLGTYEESPVSNVVNDAANPFPSYDFPNELAWDAPTDPVEEYYVYKDVGENGTFGYIGTARGAEEFRDTGLLPDYSVTPPLDRTPFVSADTRPHVATHYQQRRFYGGSNAAPDTVEASRIGFVNNFGISSPLQDDDALSFRMVGKQQHTIRHMLGLKRFLVLTDGGIWTVGRPNEPLTPSTLGADQETYAGVAANVVPVAIGNSVVYVQGRGSIVRDVRFDQEVEGLNGQDLTLFASHLFDGRTIECMDYAETPHSIVWAVRDDGVLLGMTYVRELDVWGWHRHDTDGDFEQVCTVPEADGDAVYCVVRRTIGGGSVRYIERLAKREIDSTNFTDEVFFVDSGLSYSGAPADVFSGLDHLNGEQVVAVGDGDVVRDADGDPRLFTVAGGAVTLPAEYTDVHIGLPIEADFETLNLDAHGTAIRDKKKRVGSVTILVDKSSRAFLVGPDTDSLVRYELSVFEDAVDEHTGSIEVGLSTSWNDHGRVFIRQSDPLPLTILGILPNALTEG